MTKLATLLDKFWRIALYNVTDDAIANIYVT